MATDEGLESLLSAAPSALSSWRARIDDVTKGTLAGLPLQGAACATLDSGNRTRVWEALLGCPVLDSDAQTRLCSSIESVDLDLPNARVVRVDAERTRADLPAFCNAVMQLRINRLLTYYVKAGHLLQEDAPTAVAAQPLHYKQGLNEVLAVFLQLTDESGAPLDDARVMCLFARFVSRFAPRIFASNDDEFTSLQCTFRLFRLLLLYHDPALCAALDQYDIAPELYATPWFLTLLARSNATDAALALWDVLIACTRRPGPAIFHCIALALLLTQRDAVTAHAANARDAAELPLVMAKLGLTSVAHVHRIGHMALDLWSATPLSFRRLMHNVSYSGGFHGGGEPLPISNALLTRLEARVAVKISVDELLVGTASRFSPPAVRNDTPTADTYASLQGMQRLTVSAALQVPQRYFLLDCRTRAEYDCSGHLPTAFHLDPELLQDPEKLNGIAEGFAGLKGMHFALMGPGNVSQWYHAPVPPRSDAEPASTAAASPGGDDANLYDYGITLQSARPARRDGGSGSLDADDEYVAVRSGLDPLSSNEEDDYAAEDATRAFIFFFLQKGFAHVSEVEGGFTALHQHQAHFLDTLLVGHDRTTCMVCTGGKGVSRDTAALHASPRRRVGNVTSPDGTVARRQQRYNALKDWFLGQPGLANVTGATRAFAAQARKALSSDAATPSTADDADDGDEVEIVLFPDMEAATPQPSRPRVPTGKAAPSTAAASHRAQRPGAMPVREYVTGYDVDGFPILSEEAWLDLQCDEMERDSRVAAGRSKSGAAHVTSARQATTVADAEPLYVDEIIADAAVAAAHRAASAAKSMLWSVLASPAPASPTAVAAGRGEEGAADMPKTISMAAFTAAADAADAEARIDGAPADQQLRDASSHSSSLPPATQRSLPASTGTAAKITAQTSRYMTWLARKAQAVMAAPESAVPNGAPKASSS